MTERQDIALITGASDGIGKAYALQLQTRCKRMILVGRSREKLAALVAEIRDIAGSDLQLDTIATDLSTTLGQAEVLEAIRQKGPVSLLINNAGFANQAKVAVCDLDLQRPMIDLHCTATLALCRGVLPYMREAGGGQIINVASIGGMMPGSTLAVYTASKAFVIAFSEALATEERKSGIAVQCLCPGYTRTAFQGREGILPFDASQLPDEAWSSADEVVRASLAALPSRQLLVIPGEFNQRLCVDALSRQAESIHSPS